MKHRSRTVRERRRKDLVTEKPKEDKEYPPKVKNKPWNQNRSPPFQLPNTHTHMKKSRAIICQLT